MDTHDINVTVGGRYGGGHNHRGECATTNLSSACGQTVLWVDTRANLPDTVPCQQ